MADALHTPGLLAVRLGCRADQIVRLIKLNKVPYSRAGRVHVISEENVPKVRAALIEAGYLRERGEVANATR